MPSKPTREGVAASVYRLRLAWERRKLAVSETVIGWRIGVAKFVLPRHGYGVVVEEGWDDRRV